MVDCADEGNRSRTHHRVRRTGQLQTLKTRHVMRMGMRMRVRVDGGRRRWRKSLMKTSGHADTRVIHVMLHRWMHRMMMLGRTWNDNARNVALLILLRVKKPSRERERERDACSILSVYTVK